MVAVQFDIRQHIEFNAKGRAVCPACALAKGTSKLNLSVLPNGAYKCHRGCTPQEIRDALGVPQDRPIPTALAQPPAPAKVTVTPQKVREAHETLMNSDGPAKQWLYDRGFTDDMIARYSLGITRSRVSDRTKPSGFTHLPSISIPIPANEDGTLFYQKKRVAPWLKEADRPDGYQPWSQYGIPARVFITWLPAEATETYLCEGEWDAMMLGRAMRQADLPIAVACFTCGCGNVPSTDQLDLMPGVVTVFYDRQDTPSKNGQRPGDEGAKKVAAALGDRGRIGAVPMPVGCQVPGWDVSDALNHGFTVEDFAAAAAQAIAHNPAPPKSPNPLKSRLISNDDLMARAPDYVEWLIPDILTMDELFVLAAPPRGGKTLLAMGLARCIATGENFLDRPVMRGAVLYVNLEDSEAKIKEREQAQNWGEGLPVYWLDRFKLSDLHHLTEIIDEMEDLRIIILDTFSRIRSDDKNEGSAEMGLILEPLQELAKSRKICILLVHHTKKINVEAANEIDVFDSIRGSGSIRATARGSIVLAAGDNCYRILAENGHGKHDLKVRQDLTTLEWKLLGKWTPLINQDQKAPVLDYLNRVGCADIDQISEGAQVPKRSLYMVLARLCADGMIRKVGNRKAAVYERAIQPIQQLNSLLNSANPYPESVISPIQQKNNFLIEGDHPESDHLNPKTDDHLTCTTPLVEKGGQNLKRLRSKDDSQMITFKDHPPLSQLFNKGGEQGSNPMPVKDSAIQQAIQQNLTVELEFNDHPPDVVRKSDHLVIIEQPISVGDKVRYRGKDASFIRVCAAKHLEVLRLSETSAEVRHGRWVVTQTIPLADLIRV